MIDQAPARLDTVQDMFKQLARLGVVLENTSKPTDYPQWAILTGLRFYSGANVGVVGEEYVATEEVAVQQIQEQLEVVAQEFAGTSMENVNAKFEAMPQPQAAMQVAEKIGHSVQMVNDGVGQNTDPEPIVVTTA